MKISQRSIEEVRETANIVEVASEFTALRRQGTSYTGLCPYPDHSEKTPSFSVTPDKGFYYCFGCLAADECIWTTKGLLPIAAAEVGEQVIGLDGRRETITDKIFRSDSTLKIKTGAAKEGIELTPDHWCVFVKKAEAIRTVSSLHYRSSESDQTRFSSRLRNRARDTKLSIEHASEVRVGDFWLYPVIPDGERDDSSLPGQHVIKPYTKGPRNERIEELRVTLETAWLYGVWLAEGSLYRGGVKWSFHAKESGTLAAKVVSILSEEFGRSGTTTVRQHKNICEVTCSSTDLSTLFSHWFGRGCANKKLPIEALRWTPECQVALINGYVDGDGYTYSGVTSTPTVSEELAYGIFALCIQARRVCSMSVTSERVGSDGVKHKKVYTVFQLSKESVKGFFAPINGTNYFWSAVREVENCREEPTTVVDITTTGSHTFLTKMGITHNCQRGGDSIKLVTDLKSLSFVEAVTYLAERSGIELEFEGGTEADSRAARERNQRRRAVHKALAAATIYYHKYLLKSQSEEAQNARNYLKDRGFEDSTIEEFRLGLAPSRENSGFLAAARKLGLDRRALDGGGLLSPRGGERFAGRIVFPISDRRGRIVGFGGRAMGDAQPKYLNSPETEVFNKRDLLYGFPQVMEPIRKQRAALVVEGYTDVLMLYQSGIKNAVATLGTATTPGHLRTLSGYADSIYILFDPDAAGEKAIERAAATASELKVDLRVLRLPQDPADWLLQNSAEEFEKLIAGAVPVIEYGIRRIVERTRGSSATERSRAVPEVQNLVREIQDPVLHREALRIAGEALGVAPEALETSGTRDAAPSKRNGEKTRYDNPIEDARREALALILARPDLTGSLLKNGVESPNLAEPLFLTQEDFGEGDPARLFAVLCEHAGEDLDSIVADERTRPLMDRIGALHAEGERLYPSSNSVKEAWLRLVILNREHTKRQTRDYDEKDRLHAEVQSLKAALRSIASQP